MNFELKAYSGDKTTVGLKTHPTTVVGGLGLYA